MPIFVKDFSWMQSDSSVTIRLPYKQGCYDKVDIFSHENYVKINFLPYICELFLMQPVESNKSKCLVNENEIVLELQKTVSEMWFGLEKPLSKAEKIELRQQIINRHQERAKEIKEARSLEKDRLHKECVREQITLDSSEREKITHLKKEVTNSAMKELDEWKMSVDKGQILTDKCHVSRTGTSKITSNTRNKKKSMTVERNKSECSQPLPCLRNTGKIDVKFTPRVFPTPMRESQNQEEEEWLKKQTEARRKVGFVEEDLKEEERDPVWLKEKGDSFFQVNNYLGAVSAYSFAIKLGSKLPSLYINRSAAHMALGNLHKTIEDCSQALELLTPCVPQNLESRARCYARRGAALCKLRLTRQGLVDLETALNLLPNDEKLQSDVSTARALVLEDSDSSND